MLQNIYVIIIIALIKVTAPKALLFEHHVPSPDLDDYEYHIQSRRKPYDLISYISFQQRSKLRTMKAKGFGFIYTPDGWATQDLNHYLSGCTEWWLQNIL